MSKIKLHAGDVEIAVANLLNYRVYTIAPNISWGLGLNHECDLLALDQKNRFTEVEIKISMSDLKKDFEKRHGHKSKYIGRLIYAFPKTMLEQALPLIPKDCGIITVEQGLYKVAKAQWYRQCKHRKDVDPVPDWMRQKFYELAAMRVWALKTTLYNLKRQK